MHIIKNNFKWNGTLSNRKSTKYLVLHHAAAQNCTVNQVHQWHLDRGWSGIGYHFFVTKDGCIYEGRPIYTVGAHTSGYNSYSIGICAEGDYSNKDKSMPTHQLRAIADLLDYLHSIFPNAQIVGHKELQATACPGQNYPLGKLKNYKNIVKDKVSDAEMEKLKQDLQNLEKRFETIEKANPIYTDLADVPMWAKDTLIKLINKGFVKGTNDGALNMSYDCIRTLVILDRAGAFKE